MRRTAFEALVRDAIADIPEFFLDIMTNVDFQVRRWPLKRHLANLEPDETLLGLYEGFFNASKNTFWALSSFLRERT